MTRTATTPAYERALAGPARRAARWLRSSAAFDAFTDPLLARLDAADLSRGYGIRRGPHGQEQGP